MEPAGKKIIFLISINVSKVIRDIPDHTKTYRTQLWYSIKELVPNPSDVV